MSMDRFTHVTELVDLFTIGKMESAIFGEIRRSVTVEQRIRSLHRILMKQPNCAEWIPLHGDDTVAVAISNKNHVIREMYDVLIDHVERMEKVTMGDVNSGESSLSKRLNMIRDNFVDVDMHDTQVKDSLRQLSLG